jgi:hypothetical protein
MIAFLGLLEDKYGGVDEYIRKYVGLSDEDIAIIKDNLLTPSRL